MIDDGLELIKALCALMESQLTLKKGSFIIYNQKYDIPNDDGLHGYISFVRAKPFGSSLGYENVPANEQLPTRLVEVQYQNVQETYSINLYSKDGSARIRNHEVIFALHSTACQQLQERYSFRMGYTPTSMTDVSHVEGAALLNRYALTFQLLRAYTRSFEIEYFDKFTIPPELTVQP